MPQRGEAYNFVRQSYQDRDGPFRIVCVSPCPEDHAIFLEIASGLTCTIECVKTVAEFRSYLVRRQPCLIVFDVLVEDGTWRDILDQHTEPEESPLVVVASDDPNECLWAEVLNLGGYDVIVKPFSKIEVGHLLISAMMRKACDRRRRLDGRLKTPSLIRAAGASENPREERTFELAGSVS